ncbi:MAG: SPFH domain-containing protein, partial [Massilia sp.]
MKAAHTRREKAFSSTNGYLAACAGVAFLLGAAWMFNTGVEAPGAVSPFIAALLMGLAGALCLTGLFMLQPNESAILTLFGKYIGTDKSEGLRWAFPLYLKRRLSLRARNFNAPTLKVNDKRGNPVEISAAVVWRVRDTAQAVFEVDDFERYVAIQAEAALRHLASQYAYDEGEGLAEG